MKSVIIEQTCVNCDHEYDCEWPSEGVCEFWRPDLDTKKMMEDKSETGIQRNY